MRSWTTCRRPSTGPEIRRPGRGSGGRSWSAVQEDTRETSQPACGYSRPPEQRARCNSLLLQICPKGSEARQNAEHEASLAEAAAALRPIVRHRLTSLVGALSCRSTIGD